jgi:hypothetical protein
MKQIFIISLVACVVIAIAVYLYTKENLYIKEKWTPTVPPKEDVPKGPGNTASLTIDSDGNLSSVATVPLGTIVMRADYWVPDGWTPCDGREPVNGIVIPDLRGRAPFGAVISANYATIGKDLNGNTLPVWGPGYATGEYYHNISGAEAPNVVLSDLTEIIKLSKQYDTDKNRMNVRKDFMSGYSGNDGFLSLGFTNASQAMSLIPPIYTVSFLIKTS